MKNLRIVLTSGNDVTQGMREFAHQQMEVILDELSNETIHSILIKVKVRKNKQQKLELTVKSTAGLFRRELSGDDYYTLLPEVVKGIKDSILKQRNKKYDHYIKRKKNGKEQLKIMDNNTKENVQEIKVKLMDPELLSIGEAVSALESVGHNFYLYLDIETGRPSVLYKKNEGGYACLELKTH